MKLIKSKITLYKQIENRVRYYSFKIYPTLFEEYIFIREYGNIKNKRPTGVINEHFKTYHDAMEKLQLLHNKKINKGYN